MELDLLYDYDVALKKCGFTQSQVDKLRELARDCDIIPKSLTNKQVGGHQICVKILIIKSSNKLSTEE